MVTSAEINQKLHNKREGITTNGYLVCDTCHSYYELQPGEKIQDFNLNCECGGTLEYFKYFPYSPYDNIQDPESPSTLVYIGYFSIIFFGIAAIPIGIILYLRGGCDKRHGIIILIITCIFLAVPVLSISMLIMYRYYFS